MSTHVQPMGRASSTYNLELIEKRLAVLREEPDSDKKRENVAYLEGLKADLEAKSNG